MNEVWIYSLVSVFLVSLLSFSGVLVIALKQKYLKGILLFFVSFAAGAMLGDVFIHLFPEYVETAGFGLSTSLYVLLGITLFFVLEKIIHWRHCHMSADSHHIHPLATMNLIGDAAHNFIDGILIAASYMLSIPVGIATTIAVALHEIPQEMGDFGVLLHAGMKTKKALFYNFFFALTSVVGALLVLALSINSSAITAIAVPITIGGFLYIANADLLPELHKDAKVSNSFFQLLSFGLGIAIMWGLTLTPLDNHGHAEEDDHIDDHQPGIQFEMDHLDDR